MKSICVECQHHRVIEYEKPNKYNHCVHENSEYTDFVEGLKSCAKNNPNGDCKNFEQEY